MAQWDGTPLLKLVVFVIWCTIELLLQRVTEAEFRCSCSTLTQSLWMSIIRMSKLQRSDDTSVWNHQFSIAATVTRWTSLKMTVWNPFSQTPDQQMANCQNSSQISASLLKACKCYQPARKQTLQRPECSDVFMSAVWFKGMMTPSSR